MKRLSVAILILSILPTYAQTPAAHPATASHKVCSDTPGASGLTGCEAMAIENAQLKNRLLNAQNEYNKLQAQLLAYENQQLGGAFTQLVDTIKANHPGMDYSPGDNSYPMGHLVSTPQRAKSNTPTAAQTKK